MFRLYSVTIIRLSARVKWKYSVTWFQILKPYRYSSLKTHNTHVTSALCWDFTQRRMEMKFRDIISVPSLKVKQSST